MDDSAPCCRDGARGEGDHVIQKVQGYKIYCCCFVIFACFIFCSSSSKCICVYMYMYIYVCTYKTKSLLIAYSTETDKSNLK